MYVIVQYRTQSPEILEAVYGPFKEHDSAANWGA